MLENNINHILAQAKHHILAQAKQRVPRNSREDVYEHTNLYRKNKYNARRVDSIPCALKR